MIRPEDIQRVREEADIVTIIGGYVNLRRSGATFRGPCPFHKGTHSNFSVGNRGSGFSYWRCFVCGEKGDIFSFLQKHLGLDFPGAVRLAADVSGIELREAEAQAPDPRAPFWEINEAAAEFFTRELWFGDPMAPRDYLRDRGLTSDDATRFQLGFAPTGETMRLYLNALGFDDDRLVAAGLLVDGDHGRHARFRNRLTFPVRDTGGHLAGFAGRVLGDGEPKYLNSPESPTFAKREILYGLHTAKNGIRKAGRALVVEGYTDVMRIVLSGISEVVAPMGTAMTPQQAALIRRFTSTAYLLYDSDGPGLKATFRNGDVLLAAGVAVRVATLPAGEDPDSFTRAHGAQGLEDLIAESIDILDRKVELLEAGGFFADVARKQEGFAKLAPTIAAASDPLVRGLYVARAAEVLGVSTEQVAQAVGQLGARR